MINNKTKKNFLRVAEAGALSFSLVAAATAQQAYNGTTGYINTPSAHTREDGTLVVGASHAEPYSMLYVAVQALPWLEVSGRYSQTDGIPSGIDPSIDSGYGSYKDKSFAAKIQLWPDAAGGMAWVPAVAIGVEDEGLGTQVFKSHYLVASKKLPLWGGELDVSLGYGAERIQGTFGGLRYTNEALPGWAWVSDYDRIDFKNDPAASLIGLGQPPGGRLAHAGEYKSV